MKMALTYIGLLLTVLAVGSGCLSTQSVYEDANNWALRENDIPAYSIEYDVFYVYPSKVMDTGGKPINWIDDYISNAIYREVKAKLTCQFGDRVRKFVPFVPQIGFNDYLEFLKSNVGNLHKLDFDDTPLATAIEQTVKALEYYLDVCNKKSKPYFLLGEGQGAVILYEAMKRCSKVNMDSGFVAAYFFGLPDVSVKRINSDFGSREIGPATGPDDLGVIVVCNTRLPGDNLEDSFAQAGNYVINPLNWRVDNTPAGPDALINAVFLNMKAVDFSKRITWVPNFCGAVADVENGVLVLTDLPEDNTRHLREQEFASDIWGIFSDNISENTENRFRKYNFLKKGLAQESVK